MVVIRLSRTGRRNLPLYRIQVADGRRWRDGKFIETIGWYNPKSDEKGKRMEVNLESYDSWVKKGAQPSETVGHLVKAFRQTAAN